MPDGLRFEDKEKRHRSEKQRDSQRLLDLVKARRLDWILIGSFGRWGVADVGEFHSALPSPVTFVSILTRANGEVVTGLD